MSEVSVDEIWLALGKWGRYQWRTLALLLPLGIVWAFQQMSTPFLAAVPSSHHCSVEGNRSHNETIPWVQDGDGLALAQCEMYVNVSANETMKCNNGWSYPDDFAGSIVTQWDLVCDNQYKVSLSASVMMVGMMAGNWKVSEIADHFGRKKVLIVSLALQVIVGVLMAVSWNYWAFFSLRFLMGICISGFGISGYIMRCELLSRSERICGIYLLGSIMWNIGLALLALLAWLVPNWRELQLILTIPTVVLLSYWWLVPESLHWLITHGYYTDAKAIIEKAAKVNNVQLNEQDVERLMYGLGNASSDEEQKTEIDKSALQVDLSADTVKTAETVTHVAEEKLTLLDVFKHPYLRCYSLVLGYLWFVLNLVYYGLSLTIGQLPGNSFLIFAMFGLCQIPVDVIAAFLVNRVGRRIPLCLSMCLAGVLLLSAVLIPEDTQSGIDVSWLITTLAMLGKVNVSVAYNTVYLYTVEVFPTVVRNIGLGFMSLCTGIGGVLAPFVVYRDGQSTPYIIFAFLAITSGIFCVILPETSGVNLGDTLDQVLKPHVHLTCCKCAHKGREQSRKVERNSL